ncbi:putative membrane protein YeaQ/YmgE (transglycosylase-associated protein family) [Arthrobacter globiformis]|uniref:hypothetical protein n=1 Tax=Arthrobacter globiformis TaxID=1665 RepID=UPI002787CF1A|nr:hypothetical protein [Arthrobacter globiformis]MDQ1060134.1 putative membrane protein YeaQ/YmgE (transglycosylase-associated protein family) [Arthrobacter globiformis]
MNQQSQGQPGQQGVGQAGPAQQGAGQAPHGAGSSGRPEAHSAAPTFMKQQGVRNEAVAGPFTVRDLTVFAATLVLFVASLIPMFAVRYNLWNLGSLFFLGLGVVLPLIVAALFAARRLAPDTKVRIGSLSVDQFGSVVASFAVGFFFLSVAGAYTPSLLVALIGSLVLLAATVLARYIPFFAGDFLDRAEVPAHIMARDSAVPVRKPKSSKEPKPAAAAPGASSTGASAGAASPGVLSGSAAGAGAASTGPESRGPVSHGSASHGSASHGATAVGQPGGGAAQAGASGTATGIWPAANAASSAAAAPETGPAAVVPSVQTGGAAQTSTVPSAEAEAAGAQPATPEAEQTQLEAATTAPAAGANSVGREAAATEAPAAEAPVAESKSDAAAGEAAEEAARAASATPATAVHPRVDIPQQARSQEPIGATVDPASRPEESEQEQVHEAFWFAVAQHRTAVDERTGAPLFGIEPGGWVLALEDRGDEFLVQHTDGRVGVLRDLSNIERG